MASDWTEVSLGEIVNFTPKRTIKKGTTAPFISMADVTENSKFIKEIFEKEYTGGGSRFANGDTLFARITPCLQNGKCSKVSGMENTEIGHGSTEFIVMAAKMPEYDEDYIYYLARLPKFRAYAESRMIGSTGRQRVSWQDLEEYEFAAPPPNERKDIGSFLSSLDDKIELNRQMNETLEAMAQALFKSWFVDFDPVIDNALAAGNDIPDEFAERAEQRKAIEKKNNTDTQVLFPDEFEFTEELGWIPKGWGLKKISDLVESVSITYPLKTVNEVIFLNTGDILAGEFLHKNYSDASSLPGQAKKSIKKDDILYSEIRPKNKRYAYVNFEADDYVVSTKLMVLRSVSSIKSLFSYFYLKQENVVLDLQYMAEDRSGTFPQITFDVLSQLTLTLPNETALVDYFTDQILVPYHNKIYKNEESSENLAKLRDTLLPKLMSGELRLEGIPND